jgi:hypothetical protein
MGCIRRMEAPIPRTDWIETSIQRAEHIMRKIDNVHDG